jgi:predicted nuclease with TOPRIM domain
MTYEAQVLEVLEQHRKETRDQFQRIEGAMTKLADAMTQQAVITTRMEEWHVRQDDAMRRIGKQVDDHENRLRSVEALAITNQTIRQTSWGTIAKVGAAVGGGAAVFFGLASLIVKAGGIG